jgi:iron complex outermembrane receptor protein
MTTRYLPAALIATSLGSLAAAQTLAQTGERDAGAQFSVLEEVIVTARRREELLSDVPASMTVFNQRQLDDTNITSLADLATYTPSLQVNNRFGTDNATFAIRGFQQELRTTASVGVYFAEVVALRGANATQSGDGAPPGDLYDLGSVQVLKGPTGTLFGRNTTGGAVLLTPNPPTDQWEGYIEGSVGNYDLRRAQAVVNMPLHENFKVRLGVDRQVRDGYIDNFSGIGPDDFADSDHTSFRVSTLWNITEAMENYTIVRYSESDNNGYPGKLIDCNPAAPLGVIFCQDDLDARIAAGQRGFYDTYNFVPNPVNKQEFWQAINTTSWEVNDAVLVKNILAYGELETKQHGAVFSTNWKFSGADFIFQQVGLANDYPTTDQETLVEELQVQVESLDGQLVWQAGLYYESSEPGGVYGSQSPALVSCDQATIQSSNPADFRCSDPLGAGALQRTPGGVEYTNKAAYAQGTYEINEQFSFTAGLRYTDDETKGFVNERIFYFPSLPPGEFGPPRDVLEDNRYPETESDEITWLLGVDYKPDEDTLIYGKYSRGYRQGSVNIASSVGADIHQPEKVDTYEIGYKGAWHGDMPGTINVAAFYNDFQDQQLQFGYFKPTGVGTTAIVNAGASTIWGLEADATVQITDNVILTAAYAYLDTNVDDFDIPVFPDGVVADGFELSFTTAEDEPLSFAPEHKLVLTGTWLLPVDRSLGDMALSATYVYTDEMQATGEEFSEYDTLPDFELINFNFNWTGLFESAFDLSLFVNNAANEKYTTYTSGLWLNGFESGQIGMPRMFGARLRYNFSED